MFLLLATDSRHAAAIYSIALTEISHFFGHNTISARLRHNNTIALRQPYEMIYFILATKSSINTAISLRSLMTLHSASFLSPIRPASTIYCSHDEFQPLQPLL